MLEYEYPSFPNFAIPILPSVKMDCGILIISFYIIIDIDVKTCYDKIENKS